MALPGPDSAAVLRLHSAAPISPTNLPKPRPKRQSGCAVARKAEHRVRGAGRAQDNQQLSVSLRRCLSAGSVDDPSTLRVDNKEITFRSSRDSTTTRPKQNPSKKPNHPSVPWSGRLLFPRRHRAVVGRLDGRPADSGRSARVLTIASQRSASVRRVIVRAVLRNGACGY